MTINSIAVCTSQVPFRSGGAENLVSSLHRELVRRGYQAEVVQIPFKWYPRVQLLKSCLAWRLIDLTESDGDRVDLVITTKFPSYLVKHPRKITWLVHQFRQVYDQIGTPYSDFGDSAEDQAYRNAIIEVDNRSLSESRRIYTIGQNVSHRLARFNGIASVPLYHPPKLVGQYHHAVYGDYVFTVGRLDRAKRLDLLIRAMAHVRSKARLVIAGTGPEREALERLVSDLNLQQRVTLVGFVSDDDLLDLYAHCRGVAYVPFDEDYGYVTLEAFHSEKPVITCGDSGGVLEFVDDEINGFVVEPEPETLAEAIDKLWTAPNRISSLGMAGKERIKDISWDSVIEGLVEE